MNLIIYISMASPPHPASRKDLIFAATFLLSVPALVGLLRLQAGQGDKARFAARDAWQRPQEVMDKLGIKPGSKVADVGCGSGYFTFHLAARVGPQGTVYAEDVESGMLENIHKRAIEEQQKQIEIVHGTAEDPRLPENQLDAILVMNAYHEMRDYDSMLRGMWRALKPGGLLAIIDHEAAMGESRSTYQEGHRIPAELVREDLARNGFSFLRSEPGFFSADTHKNFFFLIFQKPNAGLG